MDARHRLGREWHVTTADAHLLFTRMENVVYTDGESIRQDALDGVNHIGLLHK